MAAPTNILDALSLKDLDYLQRLSEEINRRFFKGEVRIRVCWGIPSASEQAEPECDISSLSESERALLVSAVSNFNAKRFEEAKIDLLPLVERGQREASQLYLKTLVRLKDESWPTVAKKINRVCTDTLYVAPGSTEQRGDDEPCIFIHPSLSKSAGLGAPKYVIAYVMFHEKLHTWLQTTPDQPHPPTFRKIEATFPDRHKAIKWLQANSFTTIEDSIL